jgi:hypothetical protein
MKNESEPLKPTERPREVSLPTSPRPRRVYPPSQERWFGVPEPTPNEACQLEPESEPSAPNEACQPAPESELSDSASAPT